MAITRQKKEMVVEKVRDIVRSAKTIIFANFKGLTVAEATEMRKVLREQGIGYTVAKKSLLRRAFGGAPFAGDLPALEGEVALAYNGTDTSAEASAKADELAPARELAAFMKKFPGHLAFVGGVFGGRYVGREEITEIAAIPGMEALRAQFIQLINSPIQRFAVVMNEIAKTKN